MGGEGDEVHRGGVVGECLNVGPGVGWGFSVEVYAAVVGR